MHLQSVRLRGMSSVCSINQNSGRATLAAARSVFITMTLGVTI